MGTARRICFVLNPWFGFNLLHFGTRYSQDDLTDLPGGSGSFHESHAPVRSKFHRRVPTQIAGVLDRPTTGPILFDDSRPAKVVKAHNQVIHLDVIERVPLLLP